MKSAMNKVSEEILAERRLWNAEAIVANTKIRKFQAGTAVEREVAASKKFVPLQPVQLSRSDFPRILSGKVGEMRPEMKPFSYYMSSQRLACAYQKVGFTPSTYRGMTAKGVKRNLAGTEHAMTVEAIYSKHLAAAQKCREEGYIVDKLLLPHPVLESTDVQPSLSWKERIAKAAALKLCGWSIHSCFQHLNHRIYIYRYRWIY
jgi:hypothetical protein